MGVRRVVPLQYVRPFGALSQRTLRTRRVEQGLHLLAPSVSRRRSPPASWTNPTVKLRWAQINGQRSDFTHGLQRRVPWFGPPSEMSTARKQLGLRTLLH